MSNLYFTYTPLTASTVARAADLNTRFSGVSAGFDLLPPPIYLYENRITYANDTGVANAYLSAPAIPITAYTAGLRLTLKALNANTGVSTINVSGLGVKQIVRADGSALQLGDIVANQILDLTYDGAAFRLSLAFADISPAGVIAKIAAGGAMTVNGLITSTGGILINSQTLNALTATGLSIAHAGSVGAVQSILGLGSMAYAATGSFVTPAQQTTALAPYAPLASPALTGTPTAPTATGGTNTTQIASTAFVTTAVGAINLSGYAPLASPIFTGSPTAPSPSNAANNTQIATTAFVVAQAYAPLASPTFTGVPLAPTAAPGTNTTQIASTAYVTAAVASGGTYAPIASPTFTGVPAGPTAAVDTNTTQLATTAYVINQAYAKLVSPAFTGTPTVPTAAGGTNTTQAASTAYVLAALTTYAPLASPTFTGVPAAPTAVGGNSTTQLATTAYVQGELGGKAAAFMTVTSFTAARTISNSDVNSLLRFTGGTTRTITMNSTPTAGFSCILANRGTVSLTLSAASGEYLNGAGATVTAITLAAAGKVTLVHEGSGIWTVDGTGAT